LTDTQGLQLIARQIIRDGRSLLQYVGEAYPYAPHQAEPAVHRLMALAKDQSAAVGRLVRFLQRHHATPPLLGSFPTEFTSANFVALVHLLPALQKDEERGIADLEQLLATLPTGEVHALLADYLQSKRQALETLNEICRLDAQAERAEPSVIPSSSPVQPTH
jgi:hypothetical protein